MAIFRRDPAKINRQFPNRELFTPRLLDSGNKPYFYSLFFSLTISVTRSNYLFFVEVGGRVNDQLQELNRDEVPTVREKLGRC